MKRFLVCLLMLFAVIQSIKANHILGGNLTYTCLGNSEYEITLTMFEDCGSSYIAVGTEYVNISNGCGIVISGLTLTNTLFQEEVSTNCSSLDTECNGGAYPGSYKHQWTGIVTLPPCDSWVISFGSCCRGTSNNSNSATASYSYKLLIDNDQTQCTSSPIFYGENTPIVCVGQDFCLNMGAYDLQGNGIQYSFVSPLTSATTVLAFSPGFSSLTPIPNVTLDSITGVLCGNVSATGNYIFAIKAEVLDSNLNVLNSVIYDLTLEVANCTNAVNFIPNDGNIVNLGSDGFLKDSNTVEMCDDSQLSFDLSFSDADLGDSLSFTSNIQTVLPGAIVTYTYPNAPDFNEINIHVEWASSSPMTGYQFFHFEIKDNSCPYNGVRNYIYKVKMLSALAIGGILVDDNGLEIGNHVFGDTITICGNQGAKLTAYGGGDVSWEYISGEPINIGVNFECDDCENSISNPSSTSVYYLERVGPSTCASRDTIVVNVVPDFSSVILPYKDTMCIGNVEELNFSISPMSAYSVDFSPIDFLNYSNSVYSYEANQAGDVNGLATIVNVDGCLQVEPIHFYIENIYALGFNIDSDLITGFCGDTVNLGIQSYLNAYCGVQFNPSSVIPDTVSVGSSTITNGTINYPAPFANWYGNAKQQYLFTASELLNAGVVAGQIKGIAWEVVQIYGTTNYNNLQLRMGCTSITGLINGFEYGLDPVLDSTDYVIQTGNNFIEFDNVYSWDGVSNLILEICYSNSSYTNNSLTPLISTSFNSSLYYRSDLANACMENNGTVSSQRPVTTFVNSAQTASNFFPANYLWSSSASLLSDSLAMTTYSVLDETTNFSLTITDTLTGCETTEKFQVEILCDTCPLASITLSGLSCYESGDASVEVVPAGLDGPFIVSVLNPNDLTVLMSDSNVLVSTTLNNLPSGTFIIRTYDTTGCWADSVLLIENPPKVTFSYQADNFLCIDSLGSVLFSGNAGFAPFEYSIDSNNFASNFDYTNLVAGEYFLQSKDVNNCFSDIVPLTIYDSVNPSVYPFYVDESCLQENGIIQITSHSIMDSIYYSIDGGVTYQNNGIFHGLPAGIYPIVIMDSVGCISDSLVQLNNVGGLLMDLVSDSLNYCIDELVQVNAISDSVIFGASWEINSIPISNFSLDWQGTFNFTGTKLIYCEVEDVYGCLVEDSINIEVYDIPYVNANASITSVLAGDDIEFNTSASNATDYHWNFGDGTSSIHDTVIYSYANHGSYTVVLIGSNPGCTSSDSLVIEVGTLGLYADLYSNDQIKLINKTNSLELIFDITNKSDLTISLFNVNGQKVYEKELSEIDSHNENIETTYFANGLYIIKVSNGDNMIFNQKFVIEK